MTPSKVRETLRSRYKYFSEQRLPDGTGTQFQLRSGVVVNAYDTGSYTVRGRRSTGVKLTLRNADRWLKLEAADVPHHLRNPGPISVDPARRCLIHAGYEILRELRSTTGTVHWRLQNGLVASVYADGTYTTEGLGKDRVDLVLARAVVQ